MSHELINEPWDVMIDDLRGFMLKQVNNDNIHGGYHIIDKICISHINQLEEQQSAFDNEINEMTADFQEDMKNVEIKHQEDMKTMNTKHQRKIHNMKSKSAEKKKQYDKMRNEVEKSAETFKKVMSVRQKTNELFNKWWKKWWEENKDNSDINFKTLADQTPMLMRKDIIKTNNGVKYALIILNDKCNEVDKDICEFYIKFNDTCHPTEYTKETVLDNLKSIRELECLKSYDLTKDICNKLIIEIEKTD